jgi:hypothetical protein
MRRVLTRRLLLRRRDAVLHGGFVREVRGCDLIHSRAGLVESRTAPLFLGNRAGITLAVLDMVALHARGADERLAGARLCERQNERVFLAHNLRFAAGVASVITPVIVSVVTSVWVVLGNWMMRHLGLRRESDPPALRTNRLHSL